MFHSLQKSTYYLFYLIVMIVWAFIILYHVGNNYEVHRNILLIVSLAFLPLYSYIFDELKGSFLRTKTPNTKQIYILLILVFVLLIGIFLDKMTLLHLLLWILSVFYIVTWEGRIFFYIALLFFLLVGVYIIFWKSWWAEQYSIYAYYFLVAWVWIQIFESLIFSEKLQKTHETNETIS